MSKEELEEVIEYEDEYYEENFIEEQEELSDNDQVEQDSKGQVKFKSVNHHKRAEANEVESDGEIATYANYALEYFGYRCALSGEKFVVFDNPVEREGNAKLTTNLSAEHIVALTTGGNDIIPNIVPTVLQYNVQKNGYYILDWWPKAKDINENSIYSPERLLKLVNYMLKSLQARKDLGIKKQPREYRKKLLTPNEIDEFLMQEEIAKSLLSDTITATNDVEDGKNILTQIPQKEGGIPSLSKQKDKETKITEAMFLTDALEVLEKEEKISQEITEKLQNMYKEVEGEIPFEIEVRKNILSVLEQMGIENNKYTVANDLLLNSGLLEQARDIEKDEILNLIEEYLKNQEEKLREILSEEQTKIAISNMPKVLYDETVVNRIEFWKKYRKTNLNELIKSNTKTDEFVDILIILKKSGINLSGIASRSTLNSIIEGLQKNEQKRVLEEIQSLGLNNNKEYPIGRILYDLKKDKNINKFKECIESINSNEINLTSDELIKLTVNTFISTDDIIEVIRILKDHDINLAIQKIDTINSIIQNKSQEEQNLIIRQLQKINYSINGEWNFSSRLQAQKNNHAIEFKESIIKLREEFIIKGKNFTEEEINRLVNKSTITLDEIVDIIRTLKEHSINIDIQKKDTIQDLINIKPKEEQERIVEELKRINPIIERNLNFGRRFQDAKSRNKEYILEKLKNNGILLTEYEYKQIALSQSDYCVSVEQIIEIMKILNKNNIPIKISKRTSIGQLIESKPEEEQQRIIEELKMIQFSIDKNWNWGRKLYDVKRKFPLELKKGIETLKLEGIEFSEYELKKLTEERTTERNITTEDMLDIIRILKQNNVEINIKQRQAISDILRENKKEEQKKIVEELQKINSKIEMNWPIGQRLSQQKRNHIKELKEGIKQLELEGIFFSEEEKDSLQKHIPKDSIEVLTGVLIELKKAGINILQIRKTDSYTVYNLINESELDEERSKELLERISEITEEVDYKIGSRICRAKTRNSANFQKSLESIKNKDKSNFFSIQEIEGITSLETEISKTLRICKILYDNGIDLKRITLNKKEKGKYRGIMLKEISQEGIDIKKIIEENNLDENFNYGSKIKMLRGSYNGTEKSPITKEERKITEILGLVKKERSSKKIIKNTIKENKDNLSDVMQVGKELEAEVLMAEKVEGRSASDGRGQ